MEEIPIKKEDNDLRSGKSKLQRKEENVKLIKVFSTDMDAIMEYYTDVIKNTPDMNRYGQWRTGLYPTYDDIKSYVEQGALYILMKDGNVIGSVAVTMEQGESYHNIAWERNVNDDEVAVVHVLCVAPAYQKKGIAKKLVEEAIRLAERNHKKAVRLDALASNLPAHRLYENLGFIHRGKQKLFAPNTGWTDFFFYEYLINKQIGEKR